MHKNDNPIKDIKDPVERAQAWKQHFLTNIDDTTSAANALIDLKNNQATKTKPFFVNLFNEALEVVGSKAAEVDLSEKQKYACLLKEVYTPC